METLALPLPTLPTFLLFFTTIYLLGYFAIFRNWSGKSRPDASSCVLSLSHGTPVVVLAAFSLLHRHQDPPPKTQFPDSNFASPNTPLQNTALEYSIAYFLTDLLHYLLFIPTDHLFIAHHVATIYVFLTCRYIVNHGAVPIVVLLVLAEVTSACQNAWTIARFLRAESPAAAGVDEYLSPLFYSVYSVVRGILGPVFVYKMGVFYSSGGAEGVIPNWVWVSWMVVIVSAIFLSILWVLNLWVELFRERRTKQMKKLG